MSIIDVIDLLGEYPAALIGIFVVIPLFSFLYGQLHARRRGNESPHKYVYSVLVYVSCIPGALSLVLTTYVFFFLRANLLAVNLLVFFLPIVSMVITLAVIGRQADVDDLPGFGRITGLFVLLIVTFILALLIQRTRIWVLFRGSIVTFILVVIVLFLALRWAAGRLFRGKG